MATDCVLWAGRLNEDGYGTIGSRLAHRVLWEAEHGPVPDGFELDHTCRRRACVNLAHLEVVTHAENVARANPYRTLRNVCHYGHIGEYRVDRSGHRYCAGCKRDKAGNYRTTKALGQPCGKGHMFDRVDGRGRVRCSACMSAAGKAAMDARWHS